MLQRRHHKINKIPQQKVYLSILVKVHPRGTSELALLASADVHRSGCNVVLQDRQHIVFHLAVHFDLHRRRKPTQLATLTCTNKYDLFVRYECRIGQ